MGLDGEQVFEGKLVAKSEDFPLWYRQVIVKAQLADYSPVRGCMVIRPSGYGLWENMQARLDRRFKATGHQNAYFPLFIPESLLQKEAEHVEGFAPEVAWITQGGSEPLQERLAVRPTSESIICAMYAKWIHSWRDLPVLINQWCSVVRWEKVTRLFLRTTEFLWQEGHTAHRTEEEAEEEARRMLDVYRDFVENDLAIPVLQGRKTEEEKFKGALRTYAVEALMPDGQALQAGTSHNLGQHFAKAFEISFQDMDGQDKYVWQTSWGVSTRLIGAVVMVHGDSSGLIMPPRVAPTQVVLVPIWKSDEERAQVGAFVQEVQAALGDDLRVFADMREQHTPGWKFNDWELRGVPVRLEIGPRDVARRGVVLARRDTRAKEPVALEALRDRVREVLDDIHHELFRRAQEFVAASSRSTSDYEEFKRIMAGPQGYIYAPWCGDRECELAIKAETTATIRVIPFDSGPGGSCMRCGQPAEATVVFAKSY